MSSCNISINTFREYLRQDNDLLIVNLSNSNLIKISIIAIACMSLIAYNFVCISRKEMHKMNNDYIKKNNECIEKNQECLVYREEIGSLKTENKIIKESYEKYKKLILDSKISELKKMKEEEDQSKIIKWIKKSAVFTQGFSLVNIAYNIARIPYNYFKG